MNTHIFPAILGLLFLLLPLSAGAENSTHIAGYTIHHNAIKTDFLSPEIASIYKIQRSKYRGMLNVSVIKDVPGTTGKPVKAKVTVQAINITGLLKTIHLREVREGDAIYYIGDFPITNGETLNFTINVTPEGITKPVTAKLSQQFFVD